MSHIARNNDFFRDKVSDLSETCLYQRIRKLKKELDMEE